MLENKRMSVYRQSLQGRILEASMRAFVQQGVRSVKMDDIAQELGISKRTLYELYSNKEQLLLEGVRKYVAIREEENRRIAASSTNVMEQMLKIYRKKVDEFKTTNPLFYTDLVKYPSVSALLGQNRAQAHEHLLSFLQRGVDEGYFRRDVSLELVAIMFESITEHVMSRQLYRDYSIQQIFHDLVLVSLRGFCTPAGIEQLDHYFSENA